MLEKPPIEDQLIISRLQEEYDLHVGELTFLPLGADLGTAVYRVVTENGGTYFLKLRKGFEEITVTVPLFLHSQGLQEIISPFTTKSKQGWTDFGEYKMILYPFIEGKDGFERELRDLHRKSLGAALRRIHTALVPPELERLIPRETFAPRWRDTLRSFQMQVENNLYENIVTAKLADFMRSKQDEITHLVERAEQLTSHLKSQSLEFVLCHSDIHGGNILMSSNDELYIVDWDNPILAPKERDLMFIGGGIDNIWKGRREEEVFYEGYGETDVDLTALT
ncbi:MAG TPA: aminoglycoside phosphotransferase family protein, partial [Anaerolineales bacterium]